MDHMGCSSWSQQLVRPGLWYMCMNERFEWQQLERLGHFHTFPSELSPLYMCIIGLFEKLLIAGVACRGG